LISASEVKEGNMKRIMNLIGLFIILFALTFGLTTLHAQSYPSYPIRMVIIAGPGDASDTSSRLLGDELGMEYKSPEELKKIMVNDYENAVVWAKKLGLSKGQ
jgi:tripartite-type tricarboxylate transporter receptor subunit TctC